MANGRSDVTDRKPAEKTFEKFLLSEYEHIAQAHFNTVVSLANFFKHYIAIVSVPFVVIGLVLNWDTERKAGIMEFLGAHPFLPLASFFAGVHRLFGDGLRDPHSL